MEKEKKPKKVLKLNNYEFLTILGCGNFVINEGSFGKVKLVKNKQDEKYSCVKIMKKEELIKAKQVDHIINEYEILNSITHPFIVFVVLF